MQNGTHGFLKIPMSLDKVWYSEDFNLSYEKYKGYKLLAWVSNYLQDIKQIVQV